MFVRRYAGNKCGQMGGNEPPLNVSCYRHRRYGKGVVGVKGWSNKDPRLLLSLMVCVGVISMFGEGTCRG